MSEDIARGTVTGLNADYLDHYLDKLRGVAPGLVRPIRYDPYQPADQQATTEEPPCRRARSKGRSRGRQPTLTDKKIQMVLHLCLNQGMSRPTVAEKLGMKVGTVRGIINGKTPRYIKAREAFLNSKRAA